jgi:hypothetical protein
VSAGTRWSYNIPPLARRVGGLVGQTALRGRGGGHFNS